MIVRGLLVAAALAVAAFGAVRHHDAARCDAAVRASSAGDVAAAQGLAARCRGSEELANAAAGLAAHHPALAERLARTAIARDPGNPRAWLGLAFALRGVRPGAARAAQRHATRLNPLGPRVVP